MNTHGNVVFTAQVYRDWARFAPGGSVLGIAPLFHITGLIGHIAVSLLGADAARSWPTASSRGWCSTRIAEHRPTYTVGAITAFIALLNAPGRHPRTHFASFTLGLLRRRGDLADGREGVPGRDRPHMHNAYGLTETHRAR